jgi:uncharacterized protein YndB with AHSA1/START domain
MSWPIEHTIHTTAAPEAVWRLWEDVPAWPQWDEGLDEISLEGPFAVGARGRIKPTGGPAWPFTLIEVDPGRAFTDETRLPLCQLRFAHTLAPAADGTTAVTLRVSFHGPLRPLFQRVIGKDIARELASQMQRLVDVAEGQEAGEASPAPSATLHA